MNLCLHSAIFTSILLEIPNLMDNLNKRLLSDFATIILIRLIDQ